MGDKLGFREVLAMGVGGIIGGGIFAVLGVAADLAGNAAFLTYLVAGVIALISGYSYIKMTEYLKEDGGSFTFLEHYVSNNNIAGMVGWVLVVGYIGTMAMYSYAFGSFAANMIGVSQGSPVRGLISIGIVALFVAVNLTGVQESGSSEDILVYAKVLILILFGGFGLYAILTRPELQFFTGGMFNHGSISAVMSIGAVFVSFEGWQLLTYEYSDIEGGIETLKKGVVYSIIISTLIYIVTALVTTSLVSPEQIIQHKETVLAFAAGKIFASSLLRKVSTYLVSIAALFSTASAINATLFGTARFSYRMASDRELPSVFSFKNKDGIPTRSLLIVGAFTAAFTFLGNLEEITTFASISFITVFGVVNYVCMKEDDVDKIWWLPWLGLVGTLSALGLLLFHLYRRQPEILVFVAGLYLVLGVIEYMYFEREEIEEEVEEIEEEVEEGVEEMEEEL